MAGVNNQQQHQRGVNNQQHDEANNHQVLFQPFTSPADISPSQTLETSSNQGLTRVARTPMYISWTVNPAIERVIDRLRHSDLLTSSSQSSTFRLKAKWKAKRRLKLIDAYRDLLYALANAKPSDRLWPSSPKLDALWRDQILDTRRYADDCQAICGRFLHHNDVSEMTLGKPTSLLQHQTSSTTPYFFQENLLNHSNKDEASRFKILLSREAYFSFLNDSAEERQILNASVEHDRFQTISTLVSSLDFSSVKRSLSNRLGGLWKSSPDYATYWECEYRRLLVLIVAYLSHPSGKCITPWCETLHDFWREHITNDTQKYAADCELIAPGRFLHHSAEASRQLARCNSMNELLLKDTILVYWSVESLLGWQGGGIEITYKGKPDGSSGRPRLFSSSSVHRR